MNRVESFVGDVGVEVILQEIVKISMLLFAPVIIFLYTSIYVLFIRLVVKKVFSFTPCSKKIAVIKYILKRHLHYFFEFIKIIPPLMPMSPPPILIDMGGIIHMNTLWVIFV